ncbi:MAG TPA: glycosyltransferase family 39 protein [Pirellulales bacterium]|nr:glycosyltransferase family 39 protein [Pirellulales bacterium]
MIGASKAWRATVATIGSRGRVALGLAVIVAAAVALRAWRLGERSLWFDEAFTWRLAGFPCAEIIERTARDNNPPLYYLLLKLWVACFGDSAVTMRLPSVLAGAASCVGTYLLVVEAFSSTRAMEPSRRQWMGLFAAALVAVTALQVRWGWEARMYAVGAALSAFSSWLLLRALHAPSGAERKGDDATAEHPPPPVAPRNAWRSWLLYFGTALAFAYTHSYALFSLAAQGIFTAAYLLAKSRWRQGALLAERRFRLALLSFAMIGAGWLPWLPVVLRQKAQVERAYWTDPLTRWSVPTLSHQIFADPENRAANQRDATVAAAACALVVLSLLWRPREGDWYLLVSTLVPLTLAVIVSASGRNILSVGCFIFSQLFLLASAARLVAKIHAWPQRTIVAAGVLTGLLLLDDDYARRIDFGNQSGLRAAATHITASRRVGEPVVVSSPWFYLPIRYHLGRDVDCRLLGSGLELAHYQGTAALTEGDFISGDELAELASERLWVVGALHDRPARWQKESEAAFYEGYGIPGSIVVVEYRTEADY